MSDLVEFLTRQLDADEAAARAATGGPWFARGQGDVARDATDMTIAKCGVTHGALEDAAHIARHDPARVLAEVAAKRAIVEAVASGFYDSDLEVALRALASVYEGAPGWQEEWR